MRGDLMSKKPVIWLGDNDKMIPYQGVCANGQEIELEESLADVVAASNKGRELTEDEKANSQKWDDFEKRKGIGKHAPKLKEGDE